MDTFDQSAMPQPEGSSSRPKTPQRPKEEMTFGKTFVASMLGFMAGIVGITILSTILFALLIASLASTETEPIVAENSVLVIPMKGSVPEFATGGSFSDILSDFSTTTTRDYLKALEKAAADDNIKGIWLQMKGFAGSTSQIEALNRGLNQFKKSGKFIYATPDDDGYSEGEYILASCADSLFIPFSGAVELNGSYALLEYYKPLLDKLNIKPIMVRAGTYKSAVEPFTRETTSPEYAEVITSIIDAQFGRVKKLVAEGRNLPVEQIDSIVANWPLLRAEPALRLGLVDRILYDDEVDDVFKAAANDGDTSKRLRTIELKKYIHQDGKADESDAENVIALVYASGAIATGESDYNPNPIFGGDQLGSTSFVKEMRKAREDENVKGIVLRINSPGGGLSPSMMMWREVKLAAEKKPVIVSMANVAASGGYYIAAPAHEIIAEETTITGSIGVFALAFNVDGFYEKTLGINTQVYRSGPHADILSLMRDLTPEELAFAEAEIDSAYQQFLQVVAEGRKMTPAQVDSVAQGRVWTGLQAKEIGLVDEIGGLELAFQRAAEKAGVENYSVEVYPKPKDKIEMILEMFDLESQSMTLDDILSMSDPNRILDVRRVVTDALKDYSGVQARLVGLRCE
ncbi:MAG: signal peptide peptidase SppA [Candidatus Kapaibacterium sp.]